MEDFFLSPKTHAVGDRVKAHWGYDPEELWFDATITAMRGDGTFDVLYDDGDFENMKPWERIRGQRTRSGRKSVPVSKLIHLNHGKKYQEEKDYRLYNLPAAIAQSTAEMVSAPSPISNPRTILPLQKVHCTTATKSEHWKLVEAFRGHLETTGKSIKVASASTGVSISEISKWTINGYHKPERMRILDGMMRAFIYEDKGKRIQESVRACKVRAAIGPARGSGGEVNVRCHLYTNWRKRKFSDFLDKSLPSDDESESPDKCPICLQSTDKYKNGMAPCCDCIFHYHCLSEWLKQSSSCPQCRKPLSKAISRMLKPMNGF